MAGISNAKSVTWRAAAVCAVTLMMTSALFSDTLRAQEEEPPYKNIMEQIFEEGAPEMKLCTGGNASRIDSLKLSQKMGQTPYYTFSGERLLSGSADPGDLVVTAVYTKSDSGRPIIWYDQTTVIEEAGVYEESVPLQLIGTQWLMVAVRSGTEWR